MNLFFFWWLCFVAHAGMDTGEAPIMAPELSAPEKLEEAVAYRRIGGFSQARELLSEIGDAPDIGAEVAYQSAILYEVEEDYAEALEAYALVIEQWPDSEVSDDARFRAAYCMEELGQHRAAIKAVRRLQRSGKWDENDTLSMQLQRGIVELRSRRPRRGIRRIQRSLDALEGSDRLAWMRAKARLALVRAQVEESARLTLKGDAKAARRLKARDALITAAEGQAIQMFKLGEPEFALEGLLLLGDAYLKLYEDMLAYPPPRSVDPAGQEVYRSVVRQRAEVLRTKAFNRYDEGVRLAVRTQWIGSAASRLREKRDELAPYVEPKSATQSDG